MVEIGPRRGAVGWGDAVTAAREVGLRSSADLAALVELLGLSVYPSRAPDVAADVTQPGPPAPAATVAAEWTTVAAPPNEVEPAQDRRTVVEKLDEAPVDAWVSEAVPLPPPSNVERAVRYKPPIVETQLRAAVATLVQRQRRSNRVDVPAAVELIAQQRPLGSVPRLNESTTARGAVVVADVGRTMMPYLDDVDRFVAELQHVVGSPNATVAWWDGKEYYVGDCGRAVPMPSDTPIVVISTLGAVRPSGAASDRAHWLEFADSAERAGADVVALVPHRLPQWPAGIAGAMRIVAWDDLPLVGRGRG